MAIKKRTPKTDAEREAAIAAFGAGAAATDDAPATATPAAAAPHTARPPKARTPRTPRTSEPSGDVPATSLVRWADEDLPRAVQRIAKAEDRSFHKAMLLLIRRGVDAYDAD